MESNAVFESHFDIVDLWIQKAIEADKLIIILKSSCHFSNISENVHPESTIPKWESKTALDSIETASTYSLMLQCTDATVSPISSCSSRR